MTETNNKIWTWMKSNWKDCLLIVFSIVIITLICSTTCTTNKNKNLQNNVKALTDSVQVLELNNGSLLYEKQSLILEKSELESYLGISQKQIKELEKKLNSSVALIADLQGKINVDTIIMTDSIYFSNNGDTINALFKYNDKWLTLNGKTLICNNVASSQINNVNMNVPLTIGLTDDYKIYAISENPYLTFTDINAASVENSITNQKKKRWGIGPYIGVGVGFGGCLGFGNSATIGNYNGFIYGVTLGISIHYDLFQW